MSLKDFNKALKLAITYWKRKSQTSSEVVGLCFPEIVTMITASTRTCF